MSWVLSRVMQTWLGVSSGISLREWRHGDAVDEGNDEVEARREHGVELAEALDHPRGLLGHDLDGLERKEHRHDDEHERKDRESRLTYILFQ